jgi:Ca-activated chloride channel homolog
MRDRVEDAGERRTPRGQEDERDWRAIVIGMLALAVIVVFSCAARADGAQMLLRAGGMDASAPWLDADYSIRVSGLVATVSVRQRFINDRSEWVEGIYLFPLPEDAAVHALRIRVGERLIEGEVREREEARATFAAARAEGRRASIVEQERPNVFRTAVANVAPRDTIEVELQYVQQLRYDAGTFSVRLPMTVAPRYMPGASPGTDAGVRAAAAQHESAVRLTHPVLHADHEARALAGVRVHVDAGFELAALESPYHEIVVTRDGAAHVVELAAGKVPMDRDFELRWRPATGARAAAAVYTEIVDGETYALLLLLPPERQAAAVQPRETIFVIDTSGSMEGPSLVQARAAVALALARLDPRDRFNVIRFASDTSSLYDVPVAVDATSRAQALDFVEALAADGGTEMAPALEAALAGAAPPGYLRQVVFVTDAGVANEDALLGQIAAQLGSARLFTVGIGAAPNAYFMRKAAELGRGSYTVIGAGHEVGARMEALLTKLASPALTNVVLEWPDGAEQWPERVPDLYAGEPVVVSARLPRLAGEVVAHGDVGGVAWSARMPLPAASDASGVATVWARRKIEALMDAERRGDGAARAAVVEVGLRHGLASRYTSFVAVERSPARPLDAALVTRDVPMLLPAGWAADAVGYGQTATAAPLHALAGLLLIALGAALRIRRSPPAFSS